MSSVATVKVIANNEQGFKIINKKDLTDKDKLFIPSKKQVFQEAKELGIKVSPRDSAEKVAKLVLDKVDEDEL